MKRILRLFMLLIVIAVVAPSCNHNKISCPTYAESFPDPKHPKKPDGPTPLPKVTKSRLSIMPPGH